MLALCPAAHAADASGLGISNQMTNLFDTLLHYTAPTAHLGQRRGVLTGGAVNARNRIMNESLWHFVPPSFNAGCGGIAHRNELSQHQVRAPVHQELLHELERGALARRTEDTAIRFCTRAGLKG